MPTFLSDPSTSTYAILAVIVFITGVLAAKSRRKKHIIPFSLALAALVALFLIDKFEESPREATVRKIAEMGAATRAKNYNDLVKNVSETFAHGSLDKKGLKALGEKVNHIGSWEGIEAWEATRANFKEVNDSTVEQGFLVQPVGMPQFQKFCIGTFKKDADGEWRLSGFKLYNPLQRTNGPEESVPML
ncbi:hypothetical protein [Zavarzinella formosa]|uniref:hypothetical protein n=1 Tax=Zavarzinella formosa TaxID=360055 RepID=UPI0002E66679|nr:hypothetical protein [Zavarzinella formosa]